MSRSGNRVCQLELGLGFGRKQVGYRRCLEGMRQPISPRKRSTHAACELDSDRRTVAFDDYHVRHVPWGVISGQNRQVEVASRELFLAVTMTVDSHCGAIELHRVEDALSDRDQIGVSARATRDQPTCLNLGVVQKEVPCEFCGAACSSI